MKKTLLATCTYCGQGFITTPDRLSIGKGKYCSKPCADKARTTRITKLCLGCNNRFEVVVSNVNQQYCSRKCWHSWHRGVNHARYKSTEVTCDHCGKLCAKTAKDLQQGEHHYCSRVCADAKHGQTIAGEKHPNWRGGALQGRGQGWNLIRLDVIERQNHKCADCGMTEQEHISKYGKSFSVHHRSPYRLDQNNNPDNLIALCPKCHGIEEKASRQRLSPQDWLKIQENTAQWRALGLDRVDYSHVYNACPTCGKPKAKKAALCRACRSKERANHRKTHFICPVCGGFKTRAEHKTCWNCHLLER